MRDKKTPSKSGASRGDRELSDFMKSVYEALSVKVLAEGAANAPPGDDAELDALDAQIERAGVALKKPSLPAPRKRTTR